MTLDEVIRAWLLEKKVSLWQDYDLNQEDQLDNAVAFLRDTIVAIAERYRADR